jgi:ferredoxin--NADP+ reductase
MGTILDYNATLDRRINISDGLAIFRFRPDKQLPEAPWFVPGQYVTIGLNNRENPKQGAVKRPMSIASSCHESRYIEFYVRLVERPTSSNPLTHLLWELREGQRAYLQPRPKGHFTVPHATREDSKNRLKLCIAAGTGLAPFVSMLRSTVQANPKAPLDDYALIHGVSYPADLAYREELEELARTRGLRYLPTVSRAHHATEWSSRVGRAEDHLHEKSLAELERSIDMARDGITPESVTVLVCGLRGTIYTSVERLLGRGFLPDDRRFRKALNIPEIIPSSLFFEKYDAEPFVDLGDSELVARLADSYYLKRPAARNPVPES